MSDFVIYNGDAFAIDRVPISYNNRAFKYGDAVFETIKCKGIYPLHFSLHYKRLVKALMSLKMDISSLPREENLESYIVKLLQKKKSFAASRVRLQVFRDGEGLYTPQTNNVNFLIEASELPSAYYKLNEKGHLVDVYAEMKKQYSPVSFFKNSNSLHYVLAAHHKNELGIHDCFLINDKDKIIETTSSNLFWIKDNIVYTPSVFSGCVDGVMRNVIINALNESGLARVIETQGTTMQELLKVDEIFTTNAVYGVQWVVGIWDKRYFSQLTKKIVQLLNRVTFK